MLTRLIARHISASSHSRVSLARGAVAHRLEARTNALLVRREVPDASSCSTERDPQACAQASRLRLNPQWEPDGVTYGSRQGPTCRAPLPGLFFSGTRDSAVALKTYVIDTSVLLSDPHALRKFAEHAVIVPWS